MPSVRELKADKANLESAILELIMRFEEEHGVFVDWVHLNSESSELNRSSVNEVSVSVSL